MPDPTESENEVINLGIEPTTQNLRKSADDVAIGNDAITKEKVTEQDIFKLAKIILIICGSIYLILAVVYAVIQQDGIKDIWHHAEVFLTSVISLVLGLYFGQKKST